MSGDTKGKDHSLSIVAIVGIIALTVCFLATQGFDFNVTFGKEKIEVTAYNSNQTSNTESL